MVALNLIEIGDEQSYEQHDAIKVTVEPYSTDQLRIQQNEKFCIEQRSRFLSIRDIVKGHDVECGFSSGYKSSFRMKNDYRKKTADNKISYVIGITNELELIEHKAMTSLRFIVIERENNDILFGLVWFYQTGAGIIPGTNTMKILIEDLYLNEKSDSAYDTGKIPISKMEDDMEIKEDMDWTRNRNFTKVSEREFERLHELQFSKSHNWFWQLSMEEASIEETALSSGDPFPEYVRLPFSLKNSPANFFKDHK